MDHIHKPRFNQTSYHEQKEAICRPSKESIVQPSPALLLDIGDINTCVF